MSKVPGVSSKRIHSDLFYLLVVVTFLRICMKFSMTTLVTTLYASLNNLLLPVFPIIATMQYTLETVYLYFMYLTQNSFVRLRKAPYADSY